MFDFFKMKKVVQKVESLTHVSDFENIDALAKYFKNETGIDFKDQKSILENKVKSFCRRHKIASVKECIDKLDTDTIHKQNLINYLTTNESYFYREFSQIEELVEHVKNTLHKVDILCIPSSHGEEPYSIVIALLEAGVSEEKFQITGVDISADAIQGAKEAVYTQKAVRNLSANILKKYFVQEENSYRLDENVKQKVRLYCMNIFSDSFKNLAKYDYIFSRNMMIYFDNETRKKAQQILQEHLKDASSTIYYGHADLTHEPILS